MNVTAQARTGDRLLRRWQVEERVGLKKSAIYNHINAGTFPEPIQLRGKRTVRWRASEIDAWIEDQSAG
jgi:prophage regulatory protein